MRYHRLTALAASLCLLVTAAAQAPILPDQDLLNAPFGRRDSLEFVSPSKVFYPETWFHFIGGNVSLKGITADLEAISDAGFSGVQLFHGQFGDVWPGTDGQIACLSPMWDKAVRHVADECARLGLRFTMQGCPGWAMAGGPWINPENAMRHLVWSRTDVDTKSSGVKLTVPQPSDEDWRDYRDIMVLAFPTPEGDNGEPLVPSSISGNISSDAACFTGKSSNTLRLDPSSADDPYWVELTFPEETVVRTIQLPCVQAMNHSWCFEPGVSVKVEAMLDNGQVVTVLDRALPQSNWQDNKPLSLSCEEARGASKYRVSFVNKHDMAFTSLSLYSAARKNNWESEAAWTLRSIDRDGQSVSYSNDAYVDGTKILDLSDKMRADGRLDWTAPYGNWTVLRIGHVNTGRQNGPAPKEGTGWECDKLSVEGSDAQFDGYIGRLISAGGALADGRLQGLLFDSWECETQTWTKDMEAEFGDRAGYGLRKWLPALFGYVIDNPEATTRFLNDWREVLGDMMSENFYGNMARRARENGLTIQYETSAGDVFPADILEYYKYADVPMCEFWQPVTAGYVGSLNFKPVKPAASAARMYGKPRVGAEAFTSFSHTWDENFRMLKEVANVNTVEGVTHLIFHTYTHNPQVDYLKPGTSFSGAGIGTPFLRGQTWWKYMPEFTTYLARCGFMLEKGRPVSDVLWFLGDEVDHKPDQECYFPRGFKYDYCNTDALLNRLSVKDGKIVTPEGIEYSLLWLPETTRMSPLTAGKLCRMVQDGAVIVGDAPKTLSTNMGGGDAAERLAEASRKIWGSYAIGKDVRKVGKGIVLSGYTLDEALACLKMRPDVDNAEVMWTHRRAEGADWYYVCAPRGKAFDGKLDFRCEGRARLWDPVSGEISDLDSKTYAGVTSVELSLPEAGACFVVFTHEEAGEEARRIACRARERISRSEISWTEPWTVRFPKGWGAPKSLSVTELRPWKSLDMSAEGKAFSGTAEYKSSFNVDAIDKDASYTLDLGAVENIAEVYVNGEYVRTLWTAPYEVDVTPFVRPGKNKVAVKVTGTWFNRLVFDAGQPESARKTWVIKWPDPEAGLRDSGLLGPVSVKVSR